MHFMEFLLVPFFIKITHRMNFLKNYILEYLKVNLKTVVYFFFLLIPSFYIFMNINNIKLISNY